MKIERISDNQIRCTLNKADLEEKELLLTELAYGTDKAKKLFSEMMQQASEELGFEVDNIPLMIEAIPIAQESLILIVTKVEDPEELDTRFSRFTKPVEKDDSMVTRELELDPNNDALMEALGSLAEGLSSLNNRRNKKSKPVTKSVAENFRIYVFKSINELTTASKLVQGVYKSENTLYKNPKNNKYYLYLGKDCNSDVEFTTTCNVISEYGDRMSVSYATPSHMEEHYKVIISMNALQTLAQI